MFPLSSSPLKLIKNPSFRPESLSYVEQLLSVNPGERFDRFQLYKNDPLHHKIRSETRIEAFSRK
jgi:hypothetical protein